MNLLQNQCLPHTGWMNSLGTWESCFSNGALWIFVALTLLTVPCVENHSCKALCLDVIWVFLNSSWKSWRRPPSGWHPPVGLLQHAKPEKAYRICIISIFLHINLFGSGQQCWKNIYELAGWLRIKALVTKSEAVRSVSETHTVEGENWLLEVTFWSHRHAVVHSHHQ